MPDENPVVSESTGSDLQPVSSVEAVVNAVPPGWVLLWDKDTPHLVPEDRAADAAVEKGLTDVRYDLDAAIADWHAQYAAKGDAIMQGIEEMQAIGYQRDETAWVIAEANGKERTAWDHLYRCVGAVIPTEGQVAAVAAHKRTHGSLDAVPTLRRFESLADTYTTPAPAASE